MSQGLSRVYSGQVRHALAVLAICLLAAGCSSTQTEVEKVSADLRFQQFAEKCVDDYLAWRPQTGTMLGLHQYDGRVTDFSRRSIQMELERLREVQRTLESIPPKTLTQQNQHDRSLLLTATRRAIFGIEQLKAYTRNPITYAEVLGIDIYIKRNFAPLQQRLDSAERILREAPNIVAHAKANLEPRLPKPHVEIAIDVASGVAQFLEKDLAEAVAGTATPSFTSARQTAVEQMRLYAQWLKSERLPIATKDFALGEAAYADMLSAGEMLDIKPKELLRLAYSELKKTQSQFAEVARQIDSTKSPIEVFKAIQQDHPTEASLVPDTTKNLEAIRQFLLQRDLVTMPSEDRALVRETPQFLRATSFASMDSPGPFEKVATEAFYYVTPVEPHWPAEQKKEWLTAFNYYTTDVVSIHEAYPGHFTHALWLRSLRGTRVRQVFTSYAFTEGWAHYTEQLMLDSGFPPASSPEERLRAAKYRLAQLDEALLRLCRMCASIEMHCNGMTVDEATRFFQDNCYYEPKPARSEATRGAYDPEYLYYTVGKLQILKLREDLRQQEGAAFSLKKFHDALLGMGGPPLRLAREQLLKDRALWGQTL